MSSEIWRNRGGGGGLSSSSTAIPPLNSIESSGCRGKGEEEAIPLPAVQPANSQRGTGRERERRGGGSGGVDYAPTPRRSQQSSRSGMDMDGGGMGGKRTNLSNTPSHCIAMQRQYRRGRGEGAVGWVFEPSTPSHHAPLPSPSFTYPLPTRCALSRGPFIAKGSC